MLQKELELYRVVCHGSSGSIVVLESEKVSEAIKRAWECIRDEGLDPHQVDIYSLDPVTLSWWSWFDKGGAK